MEITNYTRGTKMLSIAICDDQQDSLETIEEELHRSSKNLNVEIETHLYTDGNDMLGQMKNNKDYFDVVFLDIDMPKISGLDVAAKMRSINQEILLVFISAHEQYVFDSIDYSPIKYIRKLKMHDEILKGTNSMDKQKGSFALIKQFMHMNANGIIATHDLLLGTLIESFPQNIRNYCFEADITNNELTFSYQMRNGVAQNMNACFLMKKMGIAVIND